MTPSHDLLRSLAEAAGVSLRDEELDQVAAVYVEHLGYIGSLESIRLAPDAGGPLQFDLMRWLATSYPPKALQSSDR